MTAAKGHGDPAWLGDVEIELDRRVRQEPSSADAWWSLGMCRLARGRPKEALGPLETAAHLAPLRAEVSYHLALCLEQVGHAKQAVAMWERVSRLSPSTPEPHAHRARLLESIGEIDAALDARTAWVRLEPASAEALSDLAVRYSRAGRHGEAIKLFERADVVQPGFVAAHPAEAEALRTSRKALSAGRDHAAQAKQSGAPRRLTSISRDITLPPRKLRSDEEHEGRP
jgi:tetratricopeptide (TPR) repeat protein